ncbi:FkbM family methyltransferase [Microseira sp. BLCC-F43]|jgi:FkbM family methyltransferase|uniref:FkbM family methyltransferase n=1 Tax=Microseira sp. BLCC-F43 TaxID=3153602 RepID=UPI0035B7D0F9
MRVEPCCQSLLANILPVVDPKKEGICIDVGVGTFAFYCEIFAKLRFSTLAVEPLPVKKLQRICQKRNIGLIQSCLSDKNGTENLYMGTFAGLLNNNFSSLSPDWFGSSKQIKQVESITLSKLTSTIEAEKITCFKIDIEGWESQVLKQLVELPDSLIPKVVMFEYGGGINRQKGKRGWSPQFLNATMDCLAVLKQCGYGFSVMIDYAYHAKERIFDLQLSDLEPDSIFDSNAVYGNIITCHNWRYSEDEIAKLCRPYYGGWTNLVLTTILSR